MIKELTLKFGAGPGTPALTFDPGRITVIVGPNFSGKSKLIREIHQSVASGWPSADSVILEDIKYIPISREEVSEKIASIILEPNSGESVLSGYIFGTYIPS